MNTLIIGYYHLADGFKGAADSLQKYTKGTVEFFPLSAYEDSYGPKRFTYLFKFIERQLKDQELCMGTIYNPHTKIDVIIWWNFRIDFEELAKIRRLCPEVIHTFYSWDDPYWTELEEERGGNKNFQLIDVALTCCADSIDFYKRNGCPNVLFAMPGFDEKIHHPIEDQTYDCDVSIVCTNLYNTSNEGKCINRFKFLRDILKDGTISLKVYGPEKLRSYFPRDYAGFTSFEDSHKVFAKSRINVCTHIRNGSKYINERTCQILGSKGLLYISNQKDLDQLLDPSLHCVVINEADHVNQIKEILNNYDSYEAIKQKGYEHALSHMKWDHWGQTLTEGIGSFLRERSMTIGESMRSDRSLESVDQTNLIPLHPRPNGQIIKSLYLLCKLIRTTTTHNQNYLITLDAIAKKNRIDLNSFLKDNMNHLLNNEIIAY